MIFLQKLCDDEGSFKGKTKSILVKEEPEGSSFNLNEAEHFRCITPEDDSEFMDKNNKLVEDLGNCLNNVAQKEKKKRLKWKSINNQLKKKVYNCGVCEKIFTRFCDLVSHDRMDHENIPKDVLCRDCGKMFLCDSRLKIHVSTYHTEKKFPCDICGGKFLSTASLKTHKKKHSGKWVCSICRLSVGSNMALAEHMRKHTGEKPFVCDSCGRSYSTKVGLNSHHRVHTQEHHFKCDVSTRQYC